MSRRKNDRKKRKRMWITMAMILGLTVGCSGKAEEAGVVPEESEVTVSENVKKETATAKEQNEVSEKEEEILIAAAASLKNICEDELIPMFQEQHPGVRVKGTYDSSGKLQVQIEEGLEADVFLSAAQKQMKVLDEEGWIASESIVNLLENRIVLIVPEGNEQGLESFEDIERAGSIALGDPESVPAGQYAREALTSLGLWDGLQDRVSLGTNVTEVLNQVASASADAGIVYATDAASMEEKVDVVAEAPQGSLSSKVIYPTAVVKNSAHPETAGEFVDFLKTEKAMAVFEAYGFSAAE